jgi:hypothetical protein
MGRFPDVFWLRQHASATTVDDVAERTTAALRALELGRTASPGQSVAVGVGSRGITGLAEIVAATVAHLRGLGLEPFVVPAMGSHGGGDATGQEAVLAGYGITESTMGCPVRARMDVVELCRCDPGHGGRGFPLLMDRLAAAADHVVVINRVKPHTVFEGPVESGLAKMLLIGLGNADGAAVVHRAATEHGWAELVGSALPALLDRVSVLAGIAVVEDAHERTAAIEAVAGADIADREPTLLAEARLLLPRLPFDDVDIVLVDRIGKDVSGSGFDTNVLGRKGSVHQVHRERSPRVRTIVVRGLTPATAGNAMGIGLAELCRSRVVDAMDAAATGINALTSGNLPAGMVPIHLDTDRELLEACAARTGLRELADARLVWIRDTSDLDVLACSAPLVDEVRGRDDVTVLDGPRPLPIGEDGNLPDLLPRPRQ